jgi:RecA/RadA recombinase
MAKIDISKVVSSVQKLYSKDKKALSIISTGDAVRTSYGAADVSPLPAGHPLQVLAGLSGIPFNKIIQVVGKPDCGKSTWAGEALVCEQKAGIQGILWDAEEKFDANRFKNMGGKPEELIMAKTNEILKGAELVRKYILAIRDQQPDAKILFVWDSVGGSQSRSHAERELDSEKHGQPGQDAKENAQVMKMLVALINKFPDSIAVYMVNQSYAKIGFMQKGDAAAGGTKIEYHSSLIIFLKRIKTLTKVMKGVTTKYGIVTRATVSKNHLSQSETSVHQLDFQITAKGSEVTETEESNDEDGDQSE